MKENHSTGRRYDREFKDNAVALVRDGRTISRVARDLGVSTWSLARWVQAANGGQTQREPATLAAESPEQRELRRLKQGKRLPAPAARHPEKSVGHLVSGDAAARHTLMEKMKREYPVAAMAEALEVSKSGFFAQRQKDQCPRRRQDRRLVADLRPIFVEHWRSYGSPRMTRALHERGHRCGKNRVARCQRSLRSDPLSLV